MMMLFHHSPLAPLQGDFEETKAPKCWLGAEGDLRSLGLVLVISLSTAGSGDWEPWLRISRQGFPSVFPDLGREP